MKVLLIGDICTDIFVRGECNRISPEAPCIVFTDGKAETSLGMAANVRSNILSLSTDLDVHTLFPDTGSIKIRYIDYKSNQHLLRVDNDHISTALDSSRVNKILYEGQYSAVILSDYDKGWLNPYNMQDISNICFARNIPTFCDTKSVLGEWSKNISFIKINQKEFNFQINSGVVNPWNMCKNLIVTKGSHGMVMYNSVGQETYYTKPNDVQVFDVSGAGDSVLAALVVRWLETNDIYSSMDWANKVASIAVSKKGVVSVRREEVN